MLLAVLLTRQWVEGWSEPAWSAETTLRTVDSGAAAAGYALPVARFEPALQQRSPIDRHGAPFSLPLPSHAEWRSLGRATGSVPQPPEPAPLLSAARHFPLFPTGPPRQS
jgi:hypothetical protein